MARLRSLVALATPLFTTAIASASFITPPTRPTTIGGASSSRTTYQNWTAEVNLTGNTPNAGDLNPNGEATFGDTSGNGYITSTNHLYGLNGPMSLSVYIPTYASAPSYSETQFIVQIDNYGSLLVPSNGAGDLNFSGFQIDNKQISVLDDFEYRELSRTVMQTVTPGGTFTTYETENEFVFSLPGAASSHTFTYTAPANNSEVHLSVDTAVITPEPATIGLLSAGLLMLSRRKR